MGKRPGSPAAPAGKKAKKVDEFMAKCDEVANALRRSEDLPPAVRDMLCDMVPLSLKSCHEERHEYQHGVVDAVGKELVCIEEGMVKAISDAEDRLGQMSGQKESHESAVDTLTNSLMSRQSATHEHKHSLAADAMVLRAAKESLAEALGKKEACEAAVVAAQARSEELDRLLREDLAALKEGTLDPAAVPEAAAAIGPRLQGFFSLDESLLTSVPTVLAKDPGSRGHFDLMVVEQLEERAKKALEALAEAFAKETFRDSQQAAAVRSAEEAVALARETQLQSANAFVATRREEEECESELQVAQKALRGVGPEKKKREKAVGQAQTTLESFRSGPLATFRDLRDRSAQVPSSQEAASEVLGEEAAPETPAATPEA